MALIVPNTISTFIKSQFPRLYDEDGIEFEKLLQAYYEWTELSAGASGNNATFASTAIGNPINTSRNLFNIRDVDTTSNTYFSHFQNKYLYGIPNTLPGDKRFFIKHVIDIYRSKGNIQGYKLLFKLFYNDEVDIYLPKTDIFKPSDGDWDSPKYLEVVDNPNNISLVGKIIEGSASGAKAFLQSYVKESNNGSINHLFFLSNIMGNFSAGEHISEENTTDYDTIVANPFIIGSVYKLDITENNNDFVIGDVISAVDSIGINATFRVKSTSFGTGVLRFTLVENGTYYSTNAEVIISRRPRSYDTYLNNVLLYIHGTNNEVKDSSLYENFTVGINSGTNTSFIPISGTTSSISFSNNSSFISSTNTNVSFNLSNNFTIEAYIYPTSLSYYNTLFSDITGLDTVSLKNYGKEVEFYINGIRYNYTLSNPVSLNSWTHIAYVRNGTDNKFYINGIRQFTFTGSSSFFSRANKILIGYQYNFINDITDFNIDNLSNFGQFVGYFSEIRISNIARYDLNFTPYFTIPSDNSPVLSGRGAGFLLGQLSSSANISLNTDFTYTTNNYLTSTLATATTITGFSNLSIRSNSANTIGNTLTFRTFTLGIPKVLINYTQGASYVYTPEITIKDLSRSRNFISGTVTFANNSTRVTGVGTSFKSIPVSYLYFYEDKNTDTSNISLKVIKNIANNTLMFLDDYPSFNSSGNTGVTPGFPIISGNYSQYDLLDINGNQGGNNILVSVVSLTGNGLIDETELIDSGYGYKNDEQVSFRKYNYIAELNILNGGLNYSNNQYLNFVGGYPSLYATATIGTNTTGGIIRATIESPGSNFKTLPAVNIYNSNGTGAIIKAVLSTSTTGTVIKGYVRKRGLGISPGEWNSSKSFLSSDKYIQDSYYYQNYSYELRTSKPINTFEETIRKTFHPAGVNLFGRVVTKDIIADKSSASNTTITLS